MNAHSQPDRETITALWLQDFTVRQISKMVGKSRHFIRYKAKEWGLPARTLQMKVVKSRVPLAPRPKFHDAPPAIGPNGDFPANDACRFIAGEPGKNFQCCGQPGYPFCGYHRAVCYPKPRVMEAAE